MKLAMLQTADGQKLVGMTLDGQYVDLSAADHQIPGTLFELLQEKEGLARAAGALANAMRKGPFVEGQLLAPIPRPGKVICIGLNYRDHAIETKAEIPNEPVVFNKFPQCVVGPKAPVTLPAVAKKVDYEAELVAVIGKTGRNISQKDAWSHVAGYMAGNDISARDWQKGRPGGQWLLGKGADTFAPTGPWLVTADEVGDPHNLKIEFRLNGTTLQSSRTSELIFGIDRLIEWVSQLITLEPGDLIFTGTPAGVGAARQPELYLKPGDHMEVEIEHVGILSNPVEGA